MGVWMGLGGNNMLLYLAALTNVPEDLYEAAKIDGAAKWALFKNVTWPQLAPTTFFISVISLIGGFQAGFEQARVMTQGGPANTTTTISYYIYSQAFEQFKMGYASAISWVLFVIISVMTIINWKLGNRESAY
jgi:multiple sugar transport system permease protein